MRKTLNLSRLTDALIRAGMNQADLAAKLKVSREAVSKWVRGKSFPQPDKLLRIGMLVGLKFDELVRMPPAAPEPMSSPKFRGYPSRRNKVRRIAEAPAAYGAPGGEIILYRAPDGTVNLDVRLERETIWLTQKQMAELFGKDGDTIGLHLRNIYNEGELDAVSTTEEYSVVQREGTREVRRGVRFYNLDAIISVGYRVNSRRGTQFRIWATRVLREHILKGYTVNERRLRELNQAVRLIADVAQRRALTGDEATALLRVVADYSRALDLLDDYDHQRVTLTGTTRAAVTPITYEEARQAVDRLQLKFGGSKLFGREKDAGLRSSLGAVMQGFGGRDLYPSLEEKAAHLLYFVVKNHPFVDGNKRIAAALFLWFLEKNAALYRADGTKRIADNALVAMTLLIAESRPAEKDVLTRVVVNLINRQNL
jgi:prophage maintenance system killer protein/transcriptional regulator with XRE-family HTH domain